MRIGIVADDITGANDIGSMFAKHDRHTNVYDYDSLPSSLANGPLPPVAIVNTNSRLDTATLAYDKVRKSTRQLKAAGFTRFINKTCSVLRGNVGAEFDAMLDELGLEFAIVVLGFPKNGRTTIDGIHYVHGVLLEESDFRNDPIHPMVRSDLVGILQEQTRRKVALLTHRIVELGENALRCEILRMKAECNYLIIDVVDQAALQTIAKAVYDEPVLCGSSAIAEELSYLSAEDDGEPSLALPEASHCGVLCVAGSLTPQTRSQIEYAHTQGEPAIELDTRELFDSNARHSLITQVVNTLVCYLEARRNPILYSSNDVDRIAQTVKEGYRLGFSQVDVGRYISQTMGEIVKKVTDICSVNRFVILGGETSAAVCKSLGVHVLTVGKEVEPGLPSCLATEPNTLFMILKSGSFGQTDFLPKAIHHLSV